MKTLFSTNGGAGLNILRFPLGSCDFSMSNTSYDEVDGDYSLSQFSIDPDTEYIIEVITDALRINSAITIIGSPWSAPSWLKVMDSLIGLNNKNTLIDDDKIYNTYASYFIKTLSAFRQRGIHINYFTLQNEPLFGDGKDYPGMFLSSQQAFRLGQKVFEKLEKVNRAGVQKTYIIGYDHNWDNYSYPIDLLNVQEQENAGKQKVFAGTAWHCYGGTMSEALDAMTAVYPNFEQHITECTGSYPDDTCDITRGMEGFGYNHEWDMQNLFLGAVSHNAKSGTKWILALDENCGPVLSTVTYKNGRPFVSIPKYATTSADIKYNQDFWTASHLSRFFEAGAVRIGRSISSSKTSSANNLLLECVSKSAKTTCMVANLNHQNAYSLQVEDGSVSFSYNIPPWATAVLQWSSTI
jgi:glucosylceramidase